jgi:hypothetical protein
MIFCFLFYELLHETFIKLMQIPFTADFMHVFRLGTFSSILSSQGMSFKRADIIGQKKTRWPQNSSRMWDHISDQKSGRFQLFLVHSSKQYVHKIHFLNLSYGIGLTEYQMWLVKEYRPILSETAGRLTTYALTLVSVCKKPEIGETKAVQRGAHAATKWWRLGWRSQGITPTNLMPRR